MDTKTLARERMRKWRAANPEKALAASRKWASLNREKANARAAAWRLKHPEKVAEILRNYRKRHKDKIRRYSAEWSKNNREKRKTIKRKSYHKNIEKSRSLNRRRYHEKRKYIEATRKLYAFHAQLRRARKQGARGAFSQLDATNRVVMWGGLCAYCGAIATTIDHVISLSRGGTNWPANLRPACATCNSSKNNRSLNEWLGTR